jgi:hypothetical protein
VEKTEVLSEKPVSVNLGPSGDTPATDRLKHGTAPDIHSRYNVTSWEDTSLQTVFTANSA